MSKFLSFISSIAKRAQNFWISLPGNAKLALGGSWLFFACIFCSVIVLSNPRPEETSITNDDLVQTAKAEILLNTAQTEQANLPIEQPTSTAELVTTTPFPNPQFVFVNSCVRTNTFETGIVTSVVDGDTIRADIEGQNFSVRYIGIDTPDKPAPDPSAELNASLVQGESITLFRDVSDTDQFDRLLRYVYVDEVFVNYELVRQGLATALYYPPDTSCHDLFSEAQAEAQSNKIGLWLSTPTVEADTSAPIIEIVSVNKVSEYVDIHNSGTMAQDLDGWYLVSERGNQTCYLSGMIDTGETLRIWAIDVTGEGFYCGFPSNVWNNRESDPAVLYNSEGLQISRYP